MDSLLKLILTGIIVYNFNLQIQCNPTTKGPGTPRLSKDLHVRVELITPTSVLVSWELHGHATREWYLNVLKDGDVIFTARMINTTNQHMLVGLKPGTRYNVLLASFTENSETLTSSPVLVQTLEDHSTRDNDFIITTPAVRIRHPATTSNSNPARRQGVRRHTTPTKGVPDVDTDRDTTNSHSLLHEITSTTETHYGNHDDTNDGVTWKNNDDMSTHNESMQHGLPHPVKKDMTSGDEGESTDDLIKWALVGAGSFVGALIAIFIVVAALHKVQRQSDKYTIRRNSKRESAKKLVTNQAEAERETAMQEEHGNVPTTNDNLRPPEFQSLLQKRDARDNVCSVMSWGSEFDLLAEQSDNIYSNETCPIPSSQPQSNQNAPPLFSPTVKTGVNENDAIYGNTTSSRSQPPPNQQRAPHLFPRTVNTAVNENEAIYGNTTSSPSNPASSNISSHYNQTQRSPPTASADPWSQTLPIQNQNYRAITPPAIATSSTATPSSPGQHAAWNTSSTVTPSSPGHHATWNTSSTATLSPHGQHATWNTNQGLDMVIKPGSSCNAGVYVNANDQSDLYVNSKDVNNSLVVDGPPPIPRR